MTVTPLDALVRGPVSATGTVVLHGAGGSPELNVPFLDDLARSRRVVAPYYPGSGPSPRTSGPLQLDDLADRAVAAADAAGLERFDLLGYSLGSAIAVRVAARHADRVARMVLTAGIAHASTSLRLVCGVWIMLLGSGDPQTLGRFLAWASSSERAWDHRAGDPEEIALAIAAAAPAGSAEQADLVRRVDVRADLSGVRAPTLVVVPRHDRLVDLAHSAQLATGIPGARVIEIDGGHDVAGEAANAWRTAVRLADGGRRALRTHRRRPRMRVDLVLPSESANDDPRHLAELAVAAERHGFGAVWLPDHLLPPGGYSNAYGGVHEPLVTLAFLAAHTDRLLLGTSVLIAPLREPILLAKQTATLDALAPGRVLLGVGVGWERSEFDALGVEFTGRGQRSDHILDTVRGLHSTGRGPGGGTFAPTPARPVSIVVGGTSPPALRRAARLGDAWQAVGRSPGQFVVDRQHLRSLTPRAVAAGARIAWPPDQNLPALLDEIERWRRVQPAHLAIWIGDLPTAAERITALGAALQDTSG